MISEAPPLDEIVQAVDFSSQPDDWLRWIVSALARVRGPHQTQYLVKLSSWHIHSLALFRRVFPDVPWIFVYRDPLEVLVSHLQKPGLLASPGVMDPAILGMRTEDITGLTRQQWCASVLKGFLKAALGSSDDSKGLFVDYDELPEAIRGRIASHFGLSLSREDAAAVDAAMRMIPRTLAAISRAIAMPSGTNRIPRPG